MTSLPDRQQAATLIQEAQGNGARLVKACALLNLSIRTYQRWTADKAVSADQRPVVPRPAPTNKLSEAERSGRGLTVQPEGISKLSAGLHRCGSTGSGSLPGLGIHLLSGSAGEGSSTPQRSAKSAPEQAQGNYTQGHRTEPAVVVGYLMAAGASKRHLVLPVSDAGRIQPQDRRSRGLSQ